MILEALMKDMPPALQVMMKSIQGMIPGDAFHILDTVMASIAYDLANGHDQHACETMRALLDQLGIDLNDYRDHDSSE